MDRGAEATGLARRPREGRGAEVRISTCRNCGEALIWARTGRGKRIALDAEPSSDGAFVLEGDEEQPVAYRLANYAASLYRGEKYTCHFDTCEKTNTFRGGEDLD